MKYAMIVVMMAGMLLCTEKILADELTPFQTASAFVRSVEGGYVESESENGGAANYGISQTRYNTWRDHFDHRPRQSVELIEEWEVKGIYYAYWLEARCDEIAEYDIALAIAHFDMAFNSSSPRAMRTLQRTVGTKPDGLWGPKTRAALMASDPAEVLEEYLERRDRYYRQIPGERGEENLAGWLDRLENLEAFLEKEKENDA